jgi:hypothetical protein
MIMKDNIMQGLMMVLIGVLMMSGMRLADWAIPEPATKLLICVSDQDGNVGHCKSFAEYVNED